jgi:hypothetical protein
MTKSEREYLNRLAALGCIVCRNEGLYGVAAEIHHIRDGQGMGQRGSHYETVPLCARHHRTGGYGVAFHAGKKAWEARYGTERALMEQALALVVAERKKLVGAV